MHKRNLKIVKNIFKIFTTIIIVLLSSIVALCYLSATNYDENYDY